MVFSKYELERLKKKISSDLKTVHDVNLMNRIDEYINDISKLEGDKDLFFTFIKNAGTYSVGGYAFTYNINSNRIKVKYFPKDENENPRSRSIVGFQELIEWIQERELPELRVCDECGKPFNEGYCFGDGEGYSCIDCFPYYMDEMYPDGWKANENEEDEHCYLIKVKCQPELSEYEWEPFFACITDW